MRRLRPARARLYQSAAYTDLASRLAVNVRRLREAAGWTQEHAAAQCEIGPRMFQAIEAGTKAPVNATLVTLGRLSKGFDVDVVQLLRPSKYSRP